MDAAQLYLAHFPDVIARAGEPHSNSVAPGSLILRAEYGRVLS